MSRKGCNKTKKKVENSSVNRWLPDSWQQGLKYDVIDIPRVTVPGSLKKNKRKGRERKEDKLE